MIRNQQAQQAIGSSLLGLSGQSDPVVHIEAVGGGYLISSWGHGGHQRQVVTKPEALAEFVKAYCGMHVTLAENDRAHQLQGHLVTESD